MGQGAGIRFLHCSGESIAFLTAGGGAARTALARTPFGLVTRDSGWPGESSSTSGLTCVPPSTICGDLDPSEIIPWGTQGDDVDEEQVG